ncbi:hypothetical protein PR048_020246 [Dryococelus australis]|uniref:Uncharacterized protein n=1 Tax=Dryococelus australis TaxID=614101 RepID=A0ABQ9H647_9NEOP|nr:hypothetical protein PR048_020246 [Dryococelus australis]
MRKALNWRMSASVPDWEMAVEIPRHPCGVATAAAGQSRSALAHQHVSSPFAKSEPVTHELSGAYSFKTQYGWRRTGVNNVPAFNTRREQTSLVGRQGSHESYSFFTHKRTPEFLLSDELFGRYRSLKLIKPLEIRGSQCGSNYSLMTSERYDFVRSIKPKERPILSEEIWAALNSEVFRADESEVMRVWISAGMNGPGNGRSPRKPDDQLHRPTRLPLANIRIRTHQLRLEDRGSAGSQAPSRILDYPLCQSGHASAMLDFTMFVARGRQAADQFRRLLRMTSPGSQRLEALVALSVCLCEFDFTCQWLPTGIETTVPTVQVSGRQFADTLPTGCVYWVDASAHLSEPNLPNAKHNKTTNISFKMLLVSGFLGDLPFPPSLHSGAAPFSHHFTLIGFQEFVVKSCRSLSTQLNSTSGAPFFIATLTPLNVGLSAQRVRAGLDCRRWRVAFRCGRPRGCNHGTRDGSRYTNSAVGGELAAAITARDMRGGTTTDDCVVSVHLRLPGAPLPRSPLLRGRPAELPLAERRPRELSRNNNRRLTTSADLRLPARLTFLPLFFVLLQRSERCVDAILEDIKRRHCRQELLRSRGKRESMRAKRGRYEQRRNARTVDRDIFENARRLAASFGTIPKCE